MECPICGHRNKSGTKFCIQCGHKFEEKSKSGLGVAGTTAVFVVAFLVIGAVGIFVWKAGILPGMTGSSSSHYNRNLSKSSDAKEDSEAEADTVESTIPTTEATQATTAIANDQENTNSNASKEIILAGVAASNVPDYSNYLSPDNYEKLTIDTDFSFSYPSGFFSKVEQYNKNYTFSTADNSDTMYIFCELGSGDAVKDVRDAANKNKSLINAIEDKHGVLVVSDKVKDGWAHCIVGGNYTESQNGNGNGMYKVIVSNGSYIYTLDYEYGSSDNTQYYTPQNYMLECMYRYCEHSGTTYKPRTWQEFLEDQMGEKKDD